MTEYEITRLDDGRACYLPSPKMIDIWREIWGENVYHTNDGLGRLVVDLGANVGLFTRYALHRGAGHVIAVEPDPFNVSYLERNVEWCRDDVTVIPKACLYGQQRQPFVSMHHAGAWEGANSFLPVSLPSRLRSPDVRSRRGRSDHVMVDCCTLEAIMATAPARFRGQHFRMLKCDVEGSEYNIFDGATEETLARFDYISIECHAAPPEIYGRMIAALTRTHHVAILGRYDVGGSYVWCDRYNMTP